MTYQLNPLLERYDRNAKKDAALAAGAGMTGATGLSYASASPLLVAQNMKMNGLGKLEEELPQNLKNLKVNGNENIGAYLKRKGIKFNMNGHPAGPHFNPANNTIDLAFKDKYKNGKIAKSMFAHELGHSAKMQNNIARCNIYGVSKIATNGAVVAAMINCFNSDEESRKKIGNAISVAGGAASIPMIAEEIGASIRGTKMLGLKGMDRARAFIGIPSYIALAMSPWIINKVSERTRKFLKAMREAKKDNPEVQANLKELANKDIKVKI